MTYDAYEGDAYPNLRPKVPVVLGDALLVPNSGSDSLSLVDATLGQVVATAPIAALPDAKAKPALPLSIAARLRSSAIRVGFCVRAYSYPLWRPSASCT